MVLQRLLWEAQVYPSLAQEQVSLWEVPWALEGEVLILVFQFLRVPLPLLEALLVLLSSSRLKSYD